MSNVDLIARLNEWRCYGSMSGDLWDKSVRGDVAAAALALEAQDKINAALREVLTEAARYLEYLGGELAGPFTGPGMPAQAFAQARAALSLGATGEFPQGKLNDDDEGALMIGIAYDPLDGIVRVEFGKPVAWLGLPPPEAMELAKLLMANAAKAR